MRGRPRKPTRLHLVDGTARPDRANPNEPQPDPVIPVCPEWLGASARAEYRRITEELHRLQLIGQIDRALLVAYAQAWSDMRDAVLAIEKFSKMEVCLEKFEGLDSARKAKKQAVNELLRVAPHFGLSPATRAKLSAPVKQDADPFEDFLKGKAAKGSEKA